MQSKLFVTDELINVGPNLIAFEAKNGLICATVLDLYSSHSQRVASTKRANPAPMLNVFLFAEGPLFSGIAFV